MGIKKWRKTTESARPHDDVNRSASMLQLSTRLSDFPVPSINRSPACVGMQDERARSIIIIIGSCMLHSIQPSVREFLSRRRKNFLSSRKCFSTDCSPQTEIDDGTWETFKVNVTTRRRILVFLFFYQWTRISMNENSISDRHSELFSLMASRVFSRKEFNSVFLVFFVIGNSFFGWKIQSAFSMPHAWTRWEPFDNVVTGTT